MSHKVQMFIDSLLLISIPFWAVIRVQQASAYGFEAVQSVLIACFIFLVPILIVYAITRASFPYASMRILNALLIITICFYAFSYLETLLPSLRYRWQLVLWAAICLSLVLVFDRVNARQSRKLIIFIIAVLYVPLVFSFFTSSNLNNQGVETAGGDVLVRVNTENPLSTSHKPNVYFFLLDAYGRSDVLKDQLGYDNAHFIQAIKKLGFVVSDKGFANYPVTTLSQGSMLNMNYPVEAGADVLKSGENYESIYAYLRGDHASARFFKKRGYNYVHYWPGSGCEYNVDICVMHQAFYEEPTTQLLRLTPLGRLVWLFESRDDEDPLKQSVQKVLGVESKPTAKEHDIQTLDRVISQLPSDDPFFLFARILAPHPGNSYGENCSFVEGSYTVAQADYDTQRYVSDAKCAEVDIVALIKKIMRQDKNNPVIILQSDHGPEVRAQFGKKNADWDKEDIIGRFGTLSAIRMDGDCIQKHAYPTISNVNTLRLVTACVSGKVPEFLSDVSYFSTYMGRPEHGMVVPIAKDSVPLND